MKSLRLPRTAEAERLELEEHDGREVLVDHRHVDVVGREPGRLVELRPEERAILGEPARSPW